MVFLAIWLVKLRASITKFGEKMILTINLYVM
jgi:hypothetical protein